MRQALFHSSLLLHFNLHNTMRQVLFWFLFQDGETKGWWLSKLPTITLLVSRGVRNWPQVVWLQCAAMLCIYSVKNVILHNICVLKALRLPKLDWFCLWVARYPILLNTHQTALKLTVNLSAKQREKRVSFSPLWGTLAFNPCLLNKTIKYMLFKLSIVTFLN